MNDYFVWNFFCGFRTNVMFWRLKEWTRVWLICELRVSQVLPSFIVDYASARAMPRATSWLKPQVEAASQLWLKNGRLPSTRKLNGAQYTNGEATKEEERL
jgi:hypothetical protein